MFSPRGIKKNALIGGTHFYNRIHNLMFSIFYVHILHIVFYEYNYTPNRTYIPTSFFSKGFTFLVTLFHEFYPTISFLFFLHILCILFYEYS